MPEATQQLPKRLFKLTVVLCTYNEGLAILAALRSLRMNNIYPDVEIIIVDDCSQDPLTLRVLHLLKTFGHLKIIFSARNMGLSHSRNEGFNNAQSDYIVPLDGDDTLPPATLDSIYSEFINNPSADFIYGNYEIYDLLSGSSININCKYLCRDGKLSQLQLANNWQLLGTSPCKKCTWQNVGGYAMKYSYSVQDVDFWIRVLASGANGRYLDKTIYKWNRSSLGMNASFDRLDMINLLEDHSEFYQAVYSEKEIQNRIFEGHYPYKKGDIILPIIRKSFFRVTIKNKLRMLRFLLNQTFVKG